MEFTICQHINAGFLPYKMKFRMEHVQIVQITDMMVFGYWLI